MLKKQVPILLLCAGTLLFPYVLREKLLGKYALINVPIWLALFYAFLGKSITFPAHKPRKWMLISYLLVATLLLFFVPGNGWSIKRKILLFFIYILPSVFICCDVCDEFMYQYEKIWTTCLRIVCSLMCFCYVVDAIAGDTYLQTALVNFYARENLALMLSEGRFVSIWGHPLESTGIFLMLLVQGTIEREQNSKQRIKYYVDVAIAVLGISICGSKSGLLIAFILAIFCNIGFGRTKDLFVVIVILSVFRFAGFFNLIGSRIAEGVASGDVSTGRLTALKELLDKGALEFEMLKGHVLEYDNTAMIAALEFPFLGWAFTCGILFTAVQYLVYFVYPGMKVLLSKNYIVLVCLLALMAFENGSNGLYSFNDDLLIYSLNIWLILQVTARNNRGKA